MNKYSNRYFSKDGFGPTEEICSDYAPGSFINFSEYGIKETDVFVIESDQQK